MTTTDRDLREDELLAIRCQLGEPAAFDELVARWHGPLWSYLRHLLGDADAAGETLQDAWVRIVRAMPRLREPARLRAWLFGITRRTLMDRLREQYARPAEDPLDPEDVAADPPPDTTDLKALDGALGRLPVIEREVLTLFYLEELSLSEVAYATGVPVGTVKSRLFRARQLLRHEMPPRTFR